MRVVISVLVLTVVSSCTTAQTVSESYWLMLMNDGHTWCGYKDSDEFTAEANNLKPTESARITYSSGKLIELTYQFEPESGDWIVIDKYTPSNNDVLLRRANLLNN